MVEIGPVDLTSGDHVLPSIFFGEDPLLTARYFELFLSQDTKTRRLTLFSYR
jgi:hypothetical protein